MKRVSRCAKCSVCIKMCVVRRGSVKGTGYKGNADGNIRSKILHGRIVNFMVHLQR